MVATLSEEKNASLMQMIGQHQLQSNRDGCQRLQVESHTAFSYNTKRYVQVKVRTSNREHWIPMNQKVQLHQLIAWNHPDPGQRATYREAIRRSRLEVSHLCENKDCCNSDHLTMEASYKNKSRWECPVIIFINEVEHQCCKHEPKCIPSDSLRRAAQRYTCNCSSM